MAKSPPEGSSELDERPEPEAAGSAAVQVTRQAVTFVRYEESRPAAIRAILAEAPTAYLPIGPLGWSGEDAPLGEAGIRARRFCEQAAARSGGVVFPPLEWRCFGAAGQPFRFEFDPAAMAHVLEEGLRQLAEWGFQRIVVCDGGSPSPLREMLAEKCDRLTGARARVAAVELIRVSSTEGESTAAGRPAPREMEEGREAERPSFLRFEESRPAQVAERIEESPIAYLPLGALEWHGEHGPLGLDGLKAHHLCERAAERTGGVVFPTLFWGAFDTVPFPFTFHFERAHLEPLIHQLLPQLSEWGFEVIVLLSGHYPPTQIRMLRKACRRFNGQGRAISLGAPETAFGTDIEYYGDHAGMWESSIMLAIRPEWVDLSAMPRGLPVMERLTRFGTMGKDPTTRASASMGRDAIEHVATGISDAVRRVIAERSDRAFEAVYDSYARATRVLSPRVLHLIREALDVDSVGDLVRYLAWTSRNS
jgi:creatinine amidohydrolase